MPALRQVAISSLDARVDADNMASPEAIASEVNSALQLIRDDLVRLSGSLAKGKSVLVSPTNKLVILASGRLDLWAVSDTATASSTGANYHTFGSTVNGFAQLAQTYDTRRQEVPAFRGGVFLGQMTVGYGDVVQVTLIVTGAPAPTLTTANISILARLTET